MLLLYEAFFNSSLNSWAISVAAGKLPPTDFEELWRIVGFTRPYEMSNSNYPPFALSFFKFLSTVNAITVVAFLASINSLIIARIVRITVGEGMISVTKATVMALVFPAVTGPLMFATFRGSTELLVAPLVWSAYACLRQNQGLMASVFLGLVIALKPYLVIAVVLWAITARFSSKRHNSTEKRERPIRVLVVATSLALVLNLFGWVLLGREPVGTVFKSLTNLDSTSVGNASLSANSVGVFGWRTAIFAMRASLNQVAPNSFATGATVLLVFFLALTVGFFLRGRSEYLLMVCMMATICITPLSPYYRLLMVVVPLLVELPRMLQSIHRPVLFSFLIILLLVDIPSSKIQETEALLWIDVFRFPALFFLTIWCAVGVNLKKDCDSISKG